MYRIAFLSLVLIPAEELDRKEKSPKHHDRTLLPAHSPLARESSRDGLADRGRKGSRPELPSHQILSSSGGGNSSSVGGASGRAERRASFQPVGEKSPAKSGKSTSTKAEQFAVKERSASMSGKGSASGTSKAGGEKDKIASKDRTESEGRIVRRLSQPLLGPVIHKPRLGTAKTGRAESSDLG